MGLFFPFLDDPSVNIVGVEAQGGKGVDDRMQHCANLTGGRPGVLHGNRTYLLQDPDGQILEGFSISAGLDYPGIGPEHAWLHDTGRAKYVSITDAEALEAFQLCCKLEESSGAGTQPRAWPCDQTGADPAARPYHRDEYVRARGQRHLYRGQTPGFRHESIKAKALPSIHKQFSPRIDFRGYVFKRFCAMDWWQTSWRSGLATDHRPGSRSATERGGQGGRIRSVCKP